MNERREYASQQDIAALHIAVTYLGALNPAKSGARSAPVIDQYSEQEGHSRGLEAFFVATDVPGVALQPGSAPRCYRMRPARYTMRRHQLCT